MAASLQFSPPSSVQTMAEPGCPLATDPIVTPCTRSVNCTWQALAGPGITISISPAGALRNGPPPASNSRTAAVRRDHFVLSPVMRVSSPFSVSGYIAT
jgi:hypothetical protein